MLEKAKIFARWEEALLKLHLHYKPANQTSHVHKPEICVERGIPFELRLVPSLLDKPLGEKKPRAPSLTAAEEKHADPASSTGSVAELAALDINFDPFAIPNPDLLVGPLGAGHKLVFNAYSIVKHDMLIVTNGFVSQCAPLSLADFEATRLFDQIFEHDQRFFYYNCGVQSGASILHRHIEALVFGPNEHIPIQAHVKKTKTDAHHQIDFPFAHAVAKFEKCPSPRELHDTMKVLLGAALLNASCDPLASLNVKDDVTQEPGGFTSYNLLFNAHFMLVVPRSHAVFHGSVPINALSYAGMVTGRSTKEIDLIKAKGPCFVLKDCALPKSS
ncbi:bifunctional AP-4-A phosphorylase/ADP sulfurylase [Kappamyces sp. JEL0680]|nr:bifunctional AP-4-A phosphorylase/ADP sulfurylase [Kappamyces sp. JEL0680]